jgi:hypothetical protein
MEILNLKNSGLGMAQRKGKKGQGKGRRTSKDNLLLQAFPRRQSAMTHPGSWPITMFLHAAFALKCNKNGLLFPGFI